MRSGRGGRGRARRSQTRRSLVFGHSVFCNWIRHHGICPCEEGNPRGQVIRGASVMGSTCPPLKPRRAERQAPGVASPRLAPTPPPGADQQGLGTGHGRESWKDTQATPASHSTLTLTSHLETCFGLTWCRRRHPSRTAPMGCGVSLEAWKGGTCKSHECQCEQQQAAQGRTRNKCREACPSSY